MEKATVVSPSAPASSGASQENFSPLESTNTANETDDISPSDTLAVTGAAGPPVLPFEFIALEVCLESSCRHLETETLTLQREAHQALDDLASKISTLNLECVKQIKSRLLALYGRLEKVKEYVDDTEDHIKIMLDDKQNKLLQMGVLLSTANLIIGGAAVIVDLYGMRIAIDVYDKNTPRSKFWEITLGIVGGCLLLFIIAIYFCKKRGLFLGW